DLKAMVFFMLATMAAVMITLFLGTQGVPLYAWAAALTLVGTGEIHRIMHESYGPLSAGTLGRLASARSDLKAYPEEFRPRLARNLRLLAASKEKRIAALKGMLELHRRNPELLARSKALLPAVTAVATGDYDENVQLAAVDLLGEIALEHDEAIESLREVLQAQVTQRQPFHRASALIRGIKDAREEHAARTTLSEIEEAVVQAVETDVSAEASGLILRARTLSKRMKASDSQMSGIQGHAIELAAERLQRAVASGDSGRVAVALTRLQQHLDAVPSYVD
ncbi:MAG: hypothetical protein V3S11_03865, partial [Elusimicrobiota bacterium]